MVVLGNLPKRLWQKFLLITKPPNLPTTYYLLPRKIPAMQYLPDHFEDKIVIMIG